MTLFDTVIIAALVLIGGYISVCLIKISTKRKYYSWWEKFFANKQDTAPYPLNYYKDESREEIKRLYKKAGFAFIIFIVLIVVKIYV